MLWSQIQANSFDPLKKRFEPENSSFGLELWKIKQCILNKNKYMKSFQGRVIIIDSITEKAEDRLQLRCLQEA